jgi:hypothetical protein
MSVAPIPFEFSDAAEARKVASLLRKQASAYQLLSHRLTADEIRYFEAQSRETLALAGRIEAAAAGQ